MSTKEIKKQYREEKKQSEIAELSRAFRAVKNKKYRITKQIRVGIDTHIKLKKMANAENITISKMADEIILSIPFYD